MFLHYEAFTAYIPGKTDNFLRKQTHSSYDRVLIVDRHLLRPVPEAPVLAGQMLSVVPGAFLLQEVRSQGRYVYRKNQGLEQIVGGVCVRK